MTRRKTEKMIFFKRASHEDQAGPSSKAKSSRQSRTSTRPGRGFRIKTGNVIKHAADLFSCKSGVNCSPVTPPSSLPHLHNTPLRGRRNQGSSTNEESNTLALALPSSHQRNTSPKNKATQGTKKPFLTENSSLDANARQLAASFFGPDQ